MNNTLTISKDRLKIVLEIYKRGHISFEEAEVLLATDTPISQIHPEWLKPPTFISPVINTPGMKIGNVFQPFTQQVGIDPYVTGTLTTTTFEHPIMNASNSEHGAGETLEEWEKNNGIR